MHKLRIVIGLATLPILHACEFCVQAQTRPEISIKIEPAQKVYLVGEPISIRVELTNLGGRDLLVGRNLSGVGKNPADVIFQVWDSAGHALPTLAAASDCVMVANSDSLPTAVLKRWISLSPDSGYITGVNLAVPLFTLERPARYRVSATYVSGGIGEQYWNDCLKVKPEEVARLPFRAWEGKAQSNSIWIEIAQPAEKKRIRR